ncbi:forkhead box protein G1, putative isoform 1 [Tanacetum coccineum]
MPKQKKVLQKSGLRHRKATPHSLRPCHSKIMKDYRHKKQVKSSEKKEWKDATCSVCMECPHKAVLLLCDSYHKNCRPYMCATSYRYSNCLDQYKKAYTKVNSTQNDPNISSDTEELLCPLCRGQVKGWTVVKRARKYLNAKKRSCMQDNCLFVGSYKDLRKHVRASHPLARPREVDASLVEKWKKFENDSELNDVISTIYSTMSGAVIEGDYVIEDDNRDNSRARGIGNRHLDTRTSFGPGNGHRRLPVGSNNHYLGAHTRFGPGNGHRRLPMRSRNVVNRTYGLLPRDREIAQLSEDDSASDDANAGRHVDNRNRWVGSHQYISLSADDYESDTSDEDVDDYEGIINEPAHTYSNRGGGNQSSEEEESASDDDVIITGSARNYSSHRGRFQSSSEDEFIITGRSQSSSEDESSSDDDGSIEGHVRSDNRRREPRPSYASSDIRLVRRLVRAGAGR